MDKFEYFDIPQNLKLLSVKELYALAHQIRNRIIDVVTETGGHLSSNLGVIELTIALHHVFESPKDAFIWDVSHQCYTHKLLTGRNADFPTLRTRGGLSGFSKRKESIHDWFDNGHASTAISSALGLLQSRKILGIDGKVIAIVGDGALTGGMAIEALSHAGQLRDDLIVILNDNQMSISGNTGSLSRHLSRLTATDKYQQVRHLIDAIVEKIPVLGKSLYSLIFRIKRAVKGLVFENNIFSELGFEYVGPLNGHRIEELIHVFKKIKKLKQPVVIHVVTKKGRGHSLAEKDPETFHGVSPHTGSQKSEKKLFTAVFAKKIVSLAQNDNRIVAITAAMRGGTGLTEFAQLFPTRFYDVGIAEQHAITFAGGLARGGLKPVVAIYSTFIQRGIDQFIHDIALEEVGVVFVLDRAGAVPADGETHQGLYDIALLRPIPNLVLITPASEVELDAALAWAVQLNKTVVIRYPKCFCPREENVFFEPLVLGRGVLWQNPQSQKNFLFVFTGGIKEEIFDAISILDSKNIYADAYNLRFLKPLDKDYFLSVIEPYSYILFVEDAVRIGGIGTYLESLVNRYGHKKVTAVRGFKDVFYEQGTRTQIFEDAGLSASLLAQKAMQMLLHNK